MSGFFVTVQIGSNKNIVEIVKYSNTSLDLEYTDYVCSALQDSNVEFEEFDCFLNVHGARIEENVLVRYMEQYLHHRCACLLLTVKTKSMLNLDNGSVVELNVSSYDNFEVVNTPDVEVPSILEGKLKRSNAAIGMSLIITSESIKSYLSRKTEGPKIMSHFEESGSLKNVHRRKIVSYLAALIHENFGFKPSKEQQLAVAEACVKLFPCLNLELLFNSTNSGFLQIKLKNERVKKRKIEKDFEPQADENNYSSNLPELGPEDIERDLHTLKSASLPDEIPLVQEKLKTTLDYRKAESKKENFSIYNNCRYFFVCPELIHFDFSLRYGSTQSLIKDWQPYQNHIFSIVKSSGKTVLYTELDRNIDWDTQTLSFVNLLRLLPPSPAGRVKFHRKTDEQAVNNLIVHQQTGLSNEEYIGKPTGKAPYIIAVGKSKAEIEQYLIAIDGQLIPLALNFQFIDALDLVFKLHFIFDIKYDNNLRLFWSFLQNYLYKITLVNVPVTLQDIYQKFLSLSPAN